MERLRQVESLFKTFYSVSDFDSTLRKYNFRYICGISQFDQSLTLSFWIGRIPIDYRKLPECMIKVL